MLITAKKQIAGEYGVLAPGQTSTIHIPEETVRQLEAKGYAKEYVEPVITTDDTNGKGAKK